MLMRSPARSTIGSGKSHQINPSASLTIRERIVETGHWTIAIPAIATVSLKKSSRPIFRGACLLTALVFASAGMTNYTLKLLAPPEPWLLASAALTAIFVLLALRDKNRYVLALTANDGSRCAVASKDRDELEDIRAFLAEKINTQDCNTARTFDLDKVQKPNKQRSASHTRRLLAIAGPAEQTQDLAPPSYASTTSPRPEDPADRAAQALSKPANDIDANRHDGSVDYASVVGQVTDLHRFYERHPQAAHIRERLSEMELLMRAGTPSNMQRARMRELALDLSNIMAAYPHMTELFGHVSRLAGETAKEAALG